MLNFTWWVNRKDREGRNDFQGGFLGLDNIGVFDRSASLPTGGFIDQADGTAWMAMYALNLMRIALELARHNKVYEDIATKFFEHFLHIVEALNNIGDNGIGLVDEKDEFYYDVLNLPNGSNGAAQSAFTGWTHSVICGRNTRAGVVEGTSGLSRTPDMVSQLSAWPRQTRFALGRVRVGERHMLSLLRGHRMKCLLRRALDETEFLSEYGVRALSRVHLANPYEFHVNGDSMRVQYQPAESSSGLFGGNSNWRGPIWMPVNYLLIESLQKFHHYYGDDFKIECPTGSGKYLTINEVANELACRLSRIFLKTIQAVVRCMHITRSSRVIRIFATTSCSTNTSTATTARRWRIASDRVDRTDREAAATADIFQRDGVSDTSHANT
jgi:hypothetical protein